MSIIISVLEMHDAQLPQIGKTKIQLFSESSFQSLKTKLIKKQSVFQKYASKFLLKR